MESANVEAQSQIAFPIETVIGVKKERLDMEYAWMQNNSPEILSLNNNMPTGPYNGNLFPQQCFLASFIIPYLYNAYWVPVHPNFPTPNVAPHYFDENQGSTTTKTTKPARIVAGPPFTEKASPKHIKQPFGPEGANIYISHLPKLVDDEYLRSLFEPYGRVLSTKVNIDNKTGESKGIGFVSYDSREAAQRAIGAMNGYQIDHKRLKVQLKRSTAKKVAQSKKDKEDH
ncbi:unnamed protein product [Rodentolepis nana]|uniref:RRM domain-containing protein n=1 Tax=Rodentolepis nana TaxID=102285 RepID=A0A0R3TB95_RODNA|nr:unnamed protein product [Rodentolepis nana]